MTIKYLDSKRVSGVASDTKPTDVQDNSIYIETDTDRRYWFETATAPTLEDDFSSDGWTDVGGFTGVSGGVLTGDLIRNSTNHGAGRAITALDNSAWVIRFKLIINTKATGENNSVALGISQTGATGINDTRYGLGVGLSQYHNKFRLVYPANQTWYQAVVHTAGSDPVPDAGTYYIELKRTTSTSVTLNIFSDSDYSTNIATVTQTISSGINALDNLCVQGMNDNGSGGTWNISIDDLKIWDGVTSAPVDKWTSSSGISRTGCKAYFMLDETVGNPANYATTANGFSDGNGINGTNGSSGATQNATGKLGKCFEFSGGSNEEINLGDTILSGTTDFTMACWINSEVTTSGARLLFNNYASGYTGGVQFYVNGADRKLMYWSSSGSLASDTAISGTDGEWDHVVLTRSGTTMTIYLNGSADGTSTISHSIAGANMTLGGSSTGSEVFDGKIDEASIWNRALTTDEISRLYNSGNGVGI